MKQIYIIYQYDATNKLIITMATTSVHKLKRFIMRKINNNPDIFYDNEYMNKNTQIREFKSDWNILTRDKINEKLYGLKYDYVYDGEEF